MTTRRIFLSIANREHAGFRAQLRDLLTRTQFFDVVVQPDFPHTVTDTVRKLDALIAPCDLVIHLVGRDPGSPASGEAVTDFFRHTDRGAFLAVHPGARALLGDFTRLTYFQWESWLALHRGIDLLVYAEPGHAAPDFPQSVHLDALRLAQRHAETLQDDQRRCAQIVADVCQHFGILPPTVQQQIARSRLVSRHTAADFLGREKELALLDTAWAAETVNVFCIIAWGGVGKTALLARWVQTRFTEKAWKNAEGRPDPIRYFDWTFYDQGTRSDDATRAGVASVDAFFDAALTFFGDNDPARPGKGARLAHLVQGHRSLLVLDGLEPLQYPLNHPQAGQITDPDLRELLATLAQRNPGLCLVSSRQHLSDLQGAAGSSAPQHDLEELPGEVAVRLLRKLQVTGSDADLEQAARDYAGHALSLILLGRYLFAAKGGDIRKRDTIGLVKANDLRDAQTRNAWHVLEAYEQWLSSPQGRPEDVQALRLTGLFDRPASPACLAALRAAPAIPGLTDRLVPQDHDTWNLLLRRLHEAHLIQLRFPPAGENAHAPRPEPREVAVDVHPLIREYFGKQIRERQPEAFREAHSRLFDHLCETTKPHRPDTLPGLQPLYQAVTHGCLAGRQQEACDKVFYERIRRSGEAYDLKKLGAIGADLGAVAAFFDEPWTRLSPNLSAPDQAWLLNEAAFSLRALGRLTEAVEPMRVAMNSCAKSGDWKNAAVDASNLSELELTLGRLSEAVADGRRAIEFADRSGKEDWQNFISTRTTAADALHQAGERAEAGALFAKAERMQAERQPQFPLLYSVRGFRYADLLLAPAERAAWGEMLKAKGQRLKDGEPTGEMLKAKGQTPKEGALVPDSAFSLQPSALPQSPLAACAEAERRANWCIETRQPTDSMLDIALDHLTQARAALYRALLTGDSAFSLQPSAFSAALAKLRAANSVHHLPKALLTAAHYHGTLGGDPAAGARLLDEAQQIAERGPMPLYLADVHLHRARLAGRMNEEGRRKNYPDVDPKAELAKARALIEQHGYGRRLEELEDATAAARHWP